MDRSVNCHRCMRKLIFAQGPLMGFEDWSSPWTAFTGAHKMGHIVGIRTSSFEHRADSASCIGFEGRHSQSI